MQCLVNLFKGNHPTSSSTQKALLNSAAYTWRAVFTVAYPVEFLCLTVCKFMILDRMVLFMLHDVDNPENKWIVWRRLALAVALVGNLAGLAADAAAAAYYHAAADILSSSYTQYAANNPGEGGGLFAQGMKEQQRAANFASIQYATYSPLRDNV
jgi:hypothetical protein